MSVLSERIDGLCASSSGRAKDLMYASALRGAMAEMRARMALC